MPTTICIALGKNWESADPARDPAELLSRESRMTARAAQLLLEKGIVDRVIFSTGETNKDIPCSEARAMCTAAGFAPDDERVRLEETSKDTFENAQEVKRMLERELSEASGEIRVLLLTVDFHMPRSRRLFESAGIPIAETRSSQSVLKEHGTDNDRTEVESYDGSLLKMKRIFREAIAWGIHLIPHRLRRACVHFFRRGKQD